MEGMFIGPDGRLKPCAMSHAELITELYEATGERWHELAEEALERERRASSYPRFPAELGLDCATA